MAEPFRFDDPRQERIYRRLLQVGPGPASFYRDACRLMASDTPLETTSHLVSHLLREVESAIRDVLETMIERKDRLAKKEKGDSQHEDEIRAILKGLGISETDPVAQAWLRLPGKENSYSLNARAHRDALAPPRATDQAFREFWDEMQAILDVVLGKLETHFLGAFRLLDELLSKPSPSEADLKKLKNKVPNNIVTYRYFFDKLTSVAWLEPLKNEGFFKDTVEQDRDDEKGTISFPPWPQSNYLARMAASVPQLVLDIVLQIDTKNVRIHSDLVDAALAMPAEMAAKLVPKAIEWTESPYLSLLPEKLGALIGHLARGGQAESALKLARALLALLPDPDAKQKTGEEGKYRLSPEPRARIEHWNYQEILQKNIPDLVIAAREDALSLLCDLLDTAVRLSRRREDDEGPEEIGRASCRERV